MREEYLKELREDIAARFDCALALGATVVQPQKPDASLQFEQDTQVLFAQILQALSR